MASVAGIYGQIGAAKHFSSSVSDSLGLETEQTEAEIQELEAELAQTVDEDERKRIQKRIKRLKRKGKAVSKFANIAGGATDFLTKLAEYVDIGRMTLIRWIAAFLVKTLPALEVSVKMLLLTNIKKMLSCEIDPFIPDYWRTDGELFNERQIDPRSILKSSPYDEWGKHNYFGVYYDTDYTDRRNKHELARAEDMNAFLWYAKTSARFVSPNIISNASNFFNVGADANLYNTHKFPGNAAYKYLEGSTFKMDSQSTSIFLCEKCEIDAAGNTTYTIVPATDTWTGITWYKDINSLNGIKRSITGQSRGGINYDKSKPLFNLSYLGQYNPSGTFADGNFRFRILPKPWSTGGGWLVDLKNNVNTLGDMVSQTTQTIVTEVEGSQISDPSILSANNFKFTGIQSPIPKYARFNANGQYDKKGKYSIDTRNYTVTQTSNTSSQITYSINGTGGSCTMTYDKTTKKFILNVANMGEASKFLTECYFGKTVYEFNFDYVMSMRLFDAKTVAQGIVDALFNINIPNFFRSSGNDGSDTITDSNQVLIDNYVDMMVEKMIDTEDHEFTNCFYTFSNAEYDALEKETADKVANQALVTDNTMDGVREVYSILDAYSTDATLNEQTETITLALMKAAELSGFGDGVNGGQPVQNESLYNIDKGDGNGDFISQAVKFLISAIVNALLTPKVLLLIQVNRRLMGTDAFNIDERKNVFDRAVSVSEVLDGLSALIKGIIREVIDEIQKELLRIILQRIQEIMAAYLRRLGIEYALKWVTLLKQLLACFKWNRNKVSVTNGGGRTETGAIDSVLDQVDYADIDVLVDQILPNTNPC